MKQYFDNVNEFMVRTPKNSSTDREVNYDDEYIKKLCNDRVFREQVLVSSKSLYDVMDSYLKNKEKMSPKKERNFIESIIKYDIRSKTRTTPFGLFSVVGLGEFSNENSLKMNEDNIYKALKVDSEWLFKVIRNLEKQYQSTLVYKLNDVIWDKGNRFSVLYSVDQNTEELSMRKTGVFEIIRDKCQQYTSIDDIVAELKKKYAETPIEKMLGYLNELINKEILISDLRPPFTIENPLEYFMNKLDSYKVDGPLLNTLEEIKQMCNVYCSLPIGEGEEQFLAIISKMKEVQESKSYLQVDTAISQNDIKLSYKYAQNMNELASLFTLMTNPVKEDYSYLDDYRDKFIEKYGVDREVPILEMLDQSAGIGAPFTYTNPKNNFMDNMVRSNLYNEKLNNYFIQAYIEAVANHTDIEISEEEIKSVCGNSIDENEIPMSLELFFIVKKYNDQLQLNLSPSIGSISAGKTFGRFTYLSEDIKGLVKKAYEKGKELRDERLTLCDINFLPSSSRNGNVVQNVSFKEKELVFYTSSVKEEKDILKLKNILIGVEDDIFYARDKETGELLVFDLNHMFNPYLTSNVIRFLEDISADGYRKWNNFPWTHIYSKLRYIPRIKFKDIIIANKKWYINTDDLQLGSKFTYEAFKQKFNMFYTKANIERHVYLSIADNRLRLDLSQEYSLKLLYVELERKMKDGICLEAVEEGEDILVNQDGKAYALEIVSMFFRKNKEVKKQYPREKYSNEDEAVRNKDPFDEWLYFKLYGNKERQEELIAFEILEFCEQLKKEYGVEYFFMRYQDIRPHIRLRFNAESSVLMSVYPFIANWIKGLKEKCVISDISMATYEREVERYGGEKLIGYAERVFFTDSLIVASLLRLSRMKVISYSIEEIGVISIFHYLQQFKLSYEEQIALLEGNYYFQEFIGDFKKAKNRYLELCDFENNWSFIVNSNEGKVLLNLLKQREEAIEAYLEAYHQTSCDRLYNIIASMMHLHCNRLMGTDRKRESRVMSYCERIIHAKKFSLKNRQLVGVENESK